MRAVIVEIQNKTAAALSADGRVLKLINRGYQIGQVLDLSARKISGVKKTDRQSDGRRRNPDAVQHRRICILYALFLCES